MIASMTLLNRVGAKLAKDAAVHAMTDVTGFGLFGHAMEMARGSDATIVLKAASVPLLPEAADLVTQDSSPAHPFATGRAMATASNSTADFPEWRRHLYTDPQTSGGLLIACDAAQAEAIAQRIVDEGYPFARIIGHVEQGEPAVIMQD